MLSTWCIQCSKIVLRLCLFILCYVVLCQSSKLNQLSLTFNQKKLNQMANLENSLLYKEIANIICNTSFLFFFMVLLTCQLG